MNIRFNLLDDIVARAKRLEPQPVEELLVILVGKAENGHPESQNSKNLIEHNPSSPHALPAFSLSRKQIRAKSSCPWLPSPPRISG